MALRHYRHSFCKIEGMKKLLTVCVSLGIVLTSCDYNQVELRIIAHLAEDPGLIEAFTSGHDVHTATASRIFGVEPADVTLDQRSKAKMVSYGLAYGMEAYGLGQRLNIPTKEAAVILDAYFAAFPNVHAYMDRVVEVVFLKGAAEQQNIIGIIFGDEDNEGFRRKHGRVG